MERETSRTEETTTETPGGGADSGDTQTGKRETDSGDKQPA